MAPGVEDTPRRAPPEDGGGSEAETENDCHA